MFYVMAINTAHHLSLKTGPILFTDVYYIW